MLCMCDCLCTACVFPLDGLGFDMKEVGMGKRL